MIRSVIFLGLSALLNIPVNAQQQTPLELLNDVFIQPKGNETSPGKIRALVVGVSDYRELPKESQLNFADDDASMFYQLLISPTGAGADPTQVKLLLNKDATAAEIYAGLDWLLECDRNDRVIIFFAGHGDVENKTIRQRGFLLAHDSPRAGYQAGGTVKVMDIHDYLETLVTKNRANVLLITDACRSGKLAGGDEGQLQTTAALQEQWAGIVKILSSQPGERSAEGQQWGGGHGVFTYHLISGLKGLADSNNDGTVSLRELNLYLSSEVPNATEEKQNPLVSGNLQLKLSKVDARELASLKAAKQLESKNTNAVAARDVVVKDTVSEKTMTWYRKFRDALSARRLVSPTNESALYYYRLIEQENKSNSPYVADIRRALVSSLESDVQLVINRYMMNDKTLPFAAVRNAEVEMQTAVGLLPTSDIRYNTLLARQYFLENGFLYCICHGDESTIDEATAALKKLRASLKLEPDAAYVLNSMGNVHYTRRNYDSAKYYFLKASQLAPRWSYPLNNLGTLYEALNNREEALKYYEASLALDPDYAGIYNNLGNLYSGGKTTDNTKAVAYYMKAIELDTIGFATYYYNIGITYLSGKKDQRSKAAECFEKMKGHREAGRHFVDLRDLYMDIDRNQAFDYEQDAVGEYEKQITWHPEDAENYNSLGLLYSSSEDYADLAATNYWKAIKLQPNEAAYYENYGNHLREHSTDFDSVVYYLRKAIAIDPNGSFDLYYNLADAIQHTRTSADSAIAYVNKALAVAEKDQQAKAYNLLASCYVKLNDPAMAHELVAKALSTAKKETAEWSESYIVLASIAILQNKPDEAIKQLQEAIKYKNLNADKLQGEQFSSLKNNPNYIKIIKAATSHSGH